MADDLAPSPSEPRLRGNSAAYLRSRLERDGHVELLQAIDNGTLSTYAAGVEAGYTKRPEPLGSGSPNARKRREWAVVRAYRESGASRNVQNGQTGQNGQPRRVVGSAPTPPDLAAAIAEWEEAQRPAPPKDLRKQDKEILRERKPAPAVLPTLEDLAVFPAHPAVPCTSCRRPQAAAALREILNTYVCAARGEPHRTGNVLPRACCQWLRHPDVRALIG
jgi:hypothetical protein